MDKIKKLKYDLKRKHIGEVKIRKKRFTVMKKDEYKQGDIVFTKARGKYWFNGVIVEKLDKTYIVDINGKQYKTKLVYGEIIKGVKNGN